MANSSVLTVNAGGSSVKIHYFDAAGKPVVAASASYLDTRNHRFAIGQGTDLVEEWRPAKDIAHVCRRLLSSMHSSLASRGLEAPDVGAHRVKFAGPPSPPRRFDAQLRERVSADTPLALLHNPATLAALTAVEEAFPGATQIAVFDNQLFEGPWASQAESFLPSRVMGRYELLRNGHHGLALESVLADLSPQPETRSVLIHLGSGASVSSFVGTRPAYSSMAHSSFDGPVMNSRSGSLTAGLVLALLHAGAGFSEIARLLHRDSGVFSLAGEEYGERSLVRDLIPGLYPSPNNLYAASFAREFAAAFACAGGCDALVFSGGIARSSPAIVSMICSFIRLLGFRTRNEIPLTLPCRIDVSDMPLLALAHEREEETMFKAVSGFVESPVDALNCRTIVPGFAEGRLRASGHAAAAVASEIVYADRLSPSETLDARRFQGLIVGEGDPVGHGAALCRELALPCVVCDDPRLRRLWGKRVRLDATAGTIRPC